MRVEDFLRTSAQRAPGKPALIAGKARFTYAELDAASDRLAATFIARGVSRGDRVIVFMDNCAEAVVAILATLKAGAVFSPVNASTKADKLAYMLANSGARALVTQHRLAGVAADALAESPAVILTVVAGGQQAPSLPGAIHWQEAMAGEGGTLPFAGIDIDLAMIIYTSGSTGVPKGVVMTHRNIDAAATSITTYLENREDDVILCVLPISFDYGLYQVLMALKLGATLVLEKSFVFPQAVFETMRRERVTGFPIVPTMAALILQMRDLKPGSFPDLRYITNTAAALPPAHIARLQELFPGVRLYSMYGQTECKRCTWLPPAELVRRPGSVGIAIPNTEAFVVDETGGRAAPGVTGELVIRGPHVMQGYWRDQAATDRALKPGPLPGEKVLHTGDLFRTDAEGFLYFVGRKDDIIKSRGEKVSPKEVENVLYALPGIREAAVVGVPDPVLGAAIKAVVALEPGVNLSRDEVIRHCARHLEDFMVPKDVAFELALPKSENGKINRRDIAAREMGGDAMNTMPKSGSFAPAEPAAATGGDWMRLDAVAEVGRIAGALREQVTRRLRKRGLVIGLSGGIDSSVSAALAVAALGTRVVLGLLMPEKDSDPDSLRLGLQVAERLGIETVVEDIAPILEASRCYERRDDTIRRLVPDFGTGWGCKVVISQGAYNVTQLVVESPQGERRSMRMPLDAYLGIVAATNMKQRTRKQLEYYHADRLNYAVIGTPNRLEYDQGFFVKNGDGAADVKPIAHLYKTQVYALAEHLDLPAEVRSRPPTTDTWSLAQSQEEFYFSVPYAVMDLCLYALEHRLPAEACAREAGLTVAQVEAVWKDIASKRLATRYLHEPPLLVEPVLRA